MMCSRKLISQCLEVFTDISVKQDGRNPGSPSHRFCGEIGLRLCCLVDFLHHSEQVFSPLRATHAFSHTLPSSISRLHALSLSSNCWLVCWRTVFWTASVRSASIWNLCACTTCPALWLSSSLCRCP